MTREQTAALEWAISELNEIGVLGNEVRHMDELCRLRAALSAPKAEAEEPCPVCAKPFAAGDTCATDMELGKCHAECLADSPTVDLGTGEPVDGPIDTFPHAAPKAEAVTVKPLEWKLSWGPYDDGDECHTAFTPFGSYSVKRIDGGWVWGFCFDEYYDEDEFSCENLADGKRSAEAHWQDRCSDIVSTTSPVPALTDKAVERAAQVVHDMVCEALRDFDIRDDVIRNDPEIYSASLETARAALLAAFPSNGGE